MGLGVGSSPQGVGWWGYLHLVLLSGLHWQGAKHRQDLRAQAEAVSRLEAVARAKFRQPQRGMLTFFFIVFSLPVCCLSARLARLLLFFLCFTDAPTHA